MLNHLQWLLSPDVLRCLQYSVYGRLLFRMHIRLQNRLLQLQRMRKWMRRRLQRHMRRGMQLVLQHILLDDVLQRMRVDLLWYRDDSRVRRTFA